jgi:hypothetical protein
MKKGNNFSRLIMSIFVLFITLTERFLVAQFKQCNETHAALAVLGALSIICYMQQRAVKLLQQFLT